MAHERVVIILGQEVHALHRWDLVEQLLLEIEVRQGVLAAEDHRDWHLIDLFQTD